MKKTLTVFFLFATSIAFAQQDPYFTHFKYVQQAYNPAAAGNRAGTICFSGLTHHQWRGYQDMTRVRGDDGDLTLEPDNNVAPVTYNFNIETAFRIVDTSQMLGFGITVLDDQVWFTKGTTIMANLNYKVKLQGGAQEIAAGVGIGTRQWGYNKPDFKALHQNDPNIPVQSANEAKLDVNVGLMYKQERMLNVLKNFYAGVSMTNVNKATYNVGVNQTSITREFMPHYYAIAGGDYPLPGGNIVLEPAVLVKFAFLDASYSYEPQVDLNMTALYANTFRGGINYRQWGTIDAVSLMLGYIKRPLEVGYSYDITTSSIQGVSNGTHEIFVKYCIPIVVQPPVKIIRETPRFL